MTSVDPNVKPRGATIAAEQEVRFEPYQRGPIPWIEAELQACFPEDGLFHEYLHAVTQATDTPPLFHLFNLATRLAHIFGCRGLRYRDTGRRSRLLQLCVLCIGGPGTGKSVTNRLASTFLRDVNFQGVPPDALAEVPFNGTATQNGIITALQAGRVERTDSNHVLLVNDEAMNLLDPRRANRVDEILNKVYDGHTPEWLTAKHQEEKRAGKAESMRIDNVVANYLFATQPAMLQRAGTQDLRNNGLLTRLLFVPPRSVREIPSMRDNVEGTALAQNTLTDIIDRIEQTYIACGPEGIDTVPTAFRDEVFAGHVYARFSPEAAALFEAYAQETSDARKRIRRDKDGDTADTEGEAVQAVHRRAHAAARTIAVLYALTCPVTPTVDGNAFGYLIVQEDEARRAIVLVKLCTAYTAKHLVNVGTPDTSNSDLYAFLRNNADTTYTVGELVRERLVRRYLLEDGIRVSHHIPTVKRLLEELVEAGEVVRIDPPKTDKPTRGRPVHPRFKFVGEPTK